MRIHVGAVSPRWPSTDPRILCEGPQSFYHRSRLTGTPLNTSPVQAGCAESKRRLVL
jgi:hypothetical protein